MKSFLILALLGYGSINSRTNSYLPLNSATITSKYGVRLDPITQIATFHRGIDLKAKEGDPIYSIGFGQVVFAAKYKGFGKLIVIKHGNGITSHYAHCKSLNVDVGQMVEGGYEIAEVGMSGRVTGPHLHFELRKEGNPVDPVSVLGHSGQSHA